MNNSKSKKFQKVEIYALKKKYNKIVAEKKTVAPNIVFVETYMGELCLYGE